jgi:hypothetical protein
MNFFQRFLRLFEPNTFLVCASLVLAATAAAKVWSVAFGQVPVSPDPVVFVFSQRALLLLATMMELAVILIALTERFTIEIRCGCILSLSIAFALYRAGLHRLGISGCACVGTIPHNPILSGVLWLLLVYMISGSAWIIAARNLKWFGRVPQ